jgi:hypothetical protein
MKIKMIVITFILFIPLAEAISKTNWCYEYGLRKEYDRAIDACSSDIASGKYCGHILAYTYFNRGGAYINKGDNDRNLLYIERSENIN